MKSLNQKNKGKNNMKNSANLTLSIENMKELKECVEEALQLLESAEKSYLDAEQIQQRKNIIAGIEAAIAHAEMQ